MVAVVDQDGLAEMVVMVVVQVLLVLLDLALVPELEQPELVMDS